MFAKVADRLIYFELKPSSISTIFVPFAYTRARGAGDLPVAGRHFTTPQNKHERYPSYNPKKKGRFVRPF